MKIEVDIIFRGILWSHRDIIVPSQNLDIGKMIEKIIRIDIWGMTQGLV